MTGVPMDLGASRRGVDMGPSALRVADLARRLEALGHTVEEDDDVSAPLPEVLLHRASSGPGPVSAFLPAITATCRELARITADAVASGAVPVTVGGDHSIAAGSVAGAAAAFYARQERLGLIWLDAHGDAHTPLTSASGNVHGMPLAHLLGHGDADFAGISAALGGPSPAVLPGHVALVGVRDLDEPERRVLRDWGVATFTMRTIDERGLRAVMQDALAIAGRDTGGVHVSMDLDWLDPVHAPGVGTPVAGGATYREGHLAMEIIADSGRLTSLDVVEVNPVLDSQNRTAELAVGLVLSAFGQRII
ncbi:MAG TPA: arginase [Gemmatimonadaceae bacterium]|nr:arginase [Gemmatimonadaceae bacterium]